MTDEHQDHDQDHDAEDGGDRPETTSGSAPTSEYGAPWLPITGPGSGS